MTVYSLFAAPVLGMTSQAHAMNVIGTNLANVNTGGFKGTDVRFSTVLASNFDYNSDIGGVKPVNFQRISSQGFFQASPRELDVAINGEGFFLLNSQLDGNGTSYYGRDGSFQLGVEDIGVPGGPAVLGDGLGGNAPTETVTLNGQQIQVNRGFLVDKNGFYVQGFDVEPDGTPTSGLKPLRIDQFAFSSLNEATTAAELVLNIPAGQEFGETESFGISLVDSNGRLQSAFADFQKGDFTQVPPELSTNNQWSMTIRTDTGSTDPVLLEFSANGVLLDASQPQTPAPPPPTPPGGSPPATPGQPVFDLTWADGGSANVQFDLDGMTQFDGDLVAFKFEKNGFQASEITRLQFDADGFIVASFESGENRKIYRVPLAIFTNPNGLLERNGNVFVETQFSGQRNVVDAGAQGFAQFAVNTLELSNVDMAQEFSHMILAQNAYNLSATSLRTVDEMTEVARDLKR